MDIGQLIQEMTSIGFNKFKGGSTKYNGFILSFVQYDKEDVEIIIEKDIRGDKLTYNLFKIFSKDPKKVKFINLTEKDFIEKFYGLLVDMATIIKEKKEKEETNKQE